MRQDSTAPHPVCEDCGPDSSVMTTKHFRGAARFEPSPSTEPEACHYSRYVDQPLDWRTRLVGVGCTAGVFLAIAAVSLITWQVVQPLVVRPAMTVVNLHSYEAPPEPVREVPEGPEQVEQKQQQPKEQERPDPLPEIIVPHPSNVTQPEPSPVETARDIDPVPETTAPKSLPAPPSNRTSANAETTWEALLLAHLEKYRRYPAGARAARQQGVVHVTFRMNRQGQVLSSSVLRSSGFSVLDRAALNTLRRAQPLPPIPDDRPDIVELTVPVEYFVTR